jgi:signal transduction histidine kinase
VSDRVVRILAWLAVTLIASMLVAIVALAVAGFGLRRDLDALPFFAASALIGAVIILGQPRNRIGWLMLGGGLCFLAMTFSGYYALYSEAHHAGAWPATRIMTWPQTWLWVLGAATLYVLLPLYFPNGRLISPRWRWLARSIVVIAGSVAVVSALTPGTELMQIEAEGVAVANPFGLELLRGEFFLAIGRVIEVVFPLLAFGAVIAATTHVILRFRRSSGVERQQMKWFTYAVGTFPIGIVLEQFVALPAGLIGFWLTLAPISIGIAILRYNLYDVDIIINRSLVYGALSAFVIGIYVFVVGYLGAVVHLMMDRSVSDEWSLVISLIAAGVVAVLFQPVREHLQRGVNRLMYGERDEPYAVLSRLGQRLENTLAPEAALQTIVETVREALRLPYVAIALDAAAGQQVVARSGSLQGTPLRMPLVYQQEPVGELVLSPRSPDESFGTTDRRLLADLARQIGVAAHNVRLTEQTLRLNDELQRSRERIVIAAEEERRRLRRELHDGLAPTVAALNLKAGKIRRHVRAEPDEVEVLIDEWREEIRTVIADIRRLAYELRPPILDELGLLAAIRDRAARSSTAGFTVDTDLPESVGPLPAAVEVAAYRIFNEALTNVERYAGASRCQVRVAVEESPSRALRLEVADNGAGLPVDEAFRAGVGLLSMRERADELGGSCVIGHGPDGGTRVRAWLPIVGGGG